MFSVDNFYEVFNSYYGWPEKNNVLNLFAPHGSKNWDDLIRWGLGTDKIHGSSNFNNTEALLKGGAFIMHDQEPVMLDNIEYFNDTQYPDFIKEDPSNLKKFQDRNKILPLISAVEFIKLRVKTTSFPIICHSEINSTDINELKNNNVVPCYYWWHGLVARDWFRHWKIHNSLKIKNNANAKFKFLIYSREFTGTRQYRKKVIDHLTVHQSTVNYNWGQENRLSTLSAHIDINDANNSAIHLVAETLFDTEKIYLTEKVFKPMVMCQPFIVFGPPKSLEYLRNYGFKTFGDFWDESYDYEENHDLRLNKILKLIDTLANLPQNEFYNLYERMLDTLEYNQKYFYSEEFQNVLWAELQHNCDQALITQAELLKENPEGCWIKTVGEFLEKHNFILPHWREEINILINEDPLLNQRVHDLQPKLYKLLKQN